MTATAEAPPVEINSDRRRIETWLLENTVTEYTYKHDFRLDRIDVKASRSNQARPLHPIDEDWALILAEAMHNDASEIPPIVVKKTGTKYKILDGNHRHEAANLLDRKTFPAYVITQTLTETQEQMLAYTGNLKHGLNVDMETRTRHALWLHQARGLKMAQAAHLIGVPVSKVEHLAQLERATQRVEAADHRGSNLGRGVRMRLDNIKSDIVHRELTKLAIETKMSSIEVNPIVTTINRQRSEEDQLAIVEAERARRIKEIAAGVGGKVPMPQVLRNARASLSRIVRMDIGQVVGTEADPEIKKQIKLSAQEAIKKLGKLVAEL